MKDRTQREIAAAETPPRANGLTNYDLTHLEIYIRLFDAVLAGQDRDQIAQTLFGLDRAEDPGQVDQTIEAHWQRALWMANVGYAQLLRRGSLYD